MFETDRYIKPKTRDKLFLQSRNINKLKAKEKIIFYLTEFALVDLDEETFLNSEDRKKLFIEIFKKDEKLYSEKLDIYQGAVLFKEKFNTKITQLLACYYNILSEYNVYYVNKRNIEIINEVLLAMPEEKRILYTQKAHVRLKGEGSITQFNHLEFNEDIYFTLIQDRLETAIKLSTTCKKYIQLFNYIFTKMLPLLPFKDWTTYQENRLKVIIKNIQKITSDLKTYPNNYNKLKSYVKITEMLSNEELENFLNSGL